MESFLTAFVTIIVRDIDANKYEQVYSSIARANR